MILNYLCVWMSMLPLAFGVHKMMEKMKSRQTFTLHSKPETDHAHEIVFAVKQRNLDILDSMLMERSTPGGDKYQQWMTFEEIGALTSNLEGAAAIKAWLSASGVQVTWESAHKDYIKARASVAVWDELLSASFHLWQDASLKGHKDESKLFVRTAEYSIPAELEQHIDAVFNTVQTPPVVSQSYYRSVDNSLKKSTLRVGEFFKPQAFAVPDVTVSFLNTFYGVPANTVGNALQNQSVFETSEQSFSQNDLATFQEYYGTKKQAAIDIGGFTTNACSLSGIPTNCFEGNLDIQYIMGMSQVSVAIWLLVQPLFTC